MTKEMKKIVLSVIVALIAITANAQVYVGGTFGVGSDKVETEGTEVKNTTFKILPEVGYELNEDWSVGTVVGYEYNKSGDVKTNTFTIYFKVMRAIIKSRFASSGKCWLLVGIWVSRLSSSLISLRPCSKVIPNTSLCSIGTGR